MFRSKDILTAAILTASLIVAASTQAQETFVNPNPGGPVTGIGQPAQNFYDHQLGVNFTRVNLGMSRPSVRFQPGGGTGSAIMGLRIDSLACTGLGKRIGLERGDIIVQSTVSQGYPQGQFVVGGGGAVTTNLQVIDIRTGRTVIVQVPGARLSLDIQGNAVGVPGTGRPGGETNPGNPGSRPSLLQRNGR